MYIRELQTNLLASREARTEVMKAFKEQPIAKRLTRVSYRVACRVAARRLVHVALQQRKELIAKLLSRAKKVNAITINSRGDFGEGTHRRSSDPYFYEASYLKEDDAKVPDRIDPTSQPSGEWQCNNDCKPITDDEVNAIVRLKNAFGLPMHELRQVYYNRAMTAQMNAIKEVTLWHAIKVVVSVAVSYVFCAQLQHTIKCLKHLCVKYIMPNKVMSALLALIVPWEKVILTS